MSEPGLAGVVVAASTWLTTYVLHSAVVVGAVWFLVRTGWVRRPATLDLLWKVALVAAVATASFAVLRPTRAVSRRLAVEVREAQPGARYGWGGTGPAGSELVRFQATAVDPTPACRAAMDRVRSDPRAAVPTLRRACRARGALGWRAWLVATWLVGAAGLLARALLVRAGLRRSLVGVVPADEHVVRAARELLPRSWRPVEVVVSPTMDAPCVVGGRIVLPVRCAQGLTADQVRAVLAHEVAHLVRRDPSWITLGDLLSRVLWLQPLNRLAVDGLRECAELACDDWAVARTRRPLDLASSIARVAEWIHPVRRVPAPAQAHLAHLAHGEGRVLSTRVRRILTQGAARRAAPRWLRLTLAALVVAPTLAVPAFPRAATVFAVFVREEAGVGGPSPGPETRAQDVTVLVRAAPGAGS